MLFKKIYIKLNDIEIKILLFLSKYQTNQEVTPEQISKFLNIEETIIEFYINELKIKNLINKVHVIYANDFNDYYTWSLTHTGRKYLIKNKLIK